MLNLKKRISNLWHLSEWEPQEVIEKHQSVGLSTGILFKHPKAVIIKRKRVDPIDEFIGENKDDKTTV